MVSTKPVEQYPRCVGQCSTIRQDLYLRRIESTRKFRAGLNADDREPELDCRVDFCSDSRARVIAQGDEDVPLAETKYRVVAKNNFGPPRFSLRGQARGHEELSAMAGHCGAQGLGQVVV